MSIRTDSTRLRRSVVALVVGTVIALSAWIWWGDSRHTTIDVLFASADGLNVNDNVKVLGVTVGKVTAIENDGDEVRVTLRVDADQAIPADAHAAIVSPSLVSGRFVQLAPVWTEGDRLADGATIDVARTAVPVSFDDVKQQLTDLATTLGPAAGEKGGTLAATIVALDKTLKNGNSGRLREALSELRDAATALSDGRSDMFSTVENLDKFTRNLAINDGALRGFTDELAGVSSVLATNRTALSGALRDLAGVLAQTEKYVARHHDGLIRTTQDLNLLMAALADRSNEMAGIFHVAPHALIGLHSSIQDGAITTRANLSNYGSAAQLLCGALLGIGGTSEQCRDALDPLLGLLGLAPGAER